MPRIQETVSFEDVKVKKVSEKALLCVIDGEEEWIPFSQIDSTSELDDSSDEGDEGELVVTEWIAKEKGLV